MKGDGVVVGRSSGGVTPGSGAFSDGRDMRWAGEDVLLLYMYNGLTVSSATTHACLQSLRCSL